MDRLEFDVRDLLSLHKDQSQVELALSDLDFELKELSSILGINENDRLNELVSLSEISVNLETLSLPASFDNKELAYEEELLRRELDLEYARKNKILDFAQIEYRGPHDNPWEERVSLGVALQIPYSNKRNMDINELLIKQSNIKNEASLVAQSRLIKYNQDKRLLNNLISKHEVLNRTLLSEKSKIENIAAEISKNEKVNIEILLDVKLRIAQNELTILKSEKAIYEEYIDLLQDTELICQKNSYRLLEKQ